MLPGHEESLSPPGAADSNHHSKKYLADGVRRRTWQRLPLLVAQSKSGGGVGLAALKHRIGLYVAGAQWNKEGVAYPLTKNVPASPVGVFRLHGVVAAIAGMEITPSVRVIRTLLIIMMGALLIH